jgi:hypothetical protein
MSSKKISPTLESLNTFFKTLGFISFYAAVIPFVITWWFSGRLLQAIAMAVGFSILAIILFCGTVKSQIVNSAVIPEMIAASIDDYPRLDRTCLENYTQVLESMEFKNLGDIGIGGEQGKLNPAIARVFWHSKHNCFAEVGQNFSGTDPSKDVGMRCTFGSLLDKPWLLGTFNTTAAMNGFSYMMRRAKSLWQTFSEYGIDDIQELLTTHLELRSQICSTLNLQVQTDLTLESFIHHEEDEGVQRRAVLEKKRILVALTEAYLFELNPKSEWLGDYAKFVAKSRFQSKEGNKSR